MVMATTAASLGSSEERMPINEARQLRAAGLTIALDHSGAAFGKQFKRADRSGARWALVLGDKEAEGGEVRLKPLKQQGEKSAVALTPIVELINRF